MKWIDGNNYSWDHDDMDTNCPAIVSYFLPAPISSPVIIIFPGGGYRHRAYHEGEPVARWLNQQGFHACVAIYKVKPIYKQETIQQGLDIVRIVKEKMEQTDYLQSVSLGLLGFSAGGHLASMISNLAKPNEIDFQILSYSVITMGSFSHEGSRQHLLGENPPSILIENYSAEKQVHAQTPPAFIWSTVDDSSVSVMNSLLYVEALQKNNIQYELHLFQEGKHGLGLAEEHPSANKWTDLCIHWIEQYFVK